MKVISNSIQDLFHVLNQLGPDRPWDSLVKSHLFTRHFGAGQSRQIIILEHGVWGQIHVLGVFVSDVIQGLEHTLLGLIQCLESSRPKDGGPCIIDVRLVLRLDVLQEELVQQVQQYVHLDPHNSYIKLNFDQRW